MTHSYYTLVGGACDGDGVHVLVGTPFVRAVPKLPAPSCYFQEGAISNAATPETYTRRLFRNPARSGDRIVYAHTSLDDEAVIRKLWPSEFRR